MHSGQLLRLTPSSVGSPTQMIHSVYPVSRGSHHTLRLLTPANSLKCGAPCADDTLSASRVQWRHPTMPTLNDLAQGGGPHTDDTLGASRAQREHHALRSLTPVVRLKCGAPCTDDTLGASRVWWGHQALRWPTPAVTLKVWSPLRRRYTRCIPRPQGAPHAPACPSHRYHAVRLSGQWCPPRVAMH